MTPIPGILEADHTASLSAAHFSLRRRSLDTRIPRCGGIRHGRLVGEQSGGKLIQASPVCARGHVLRIDDQVGAGSEAEKGRELGDRLAATAAALRHEHAHLFEFAPVALEPSPQRRGYRACPNRGAEHDQIVVSRMSCGGQDLGLAPSPDFPDRPPPAPQQALAGACVTDLLEIGTASRADGLGHLPGGRPALSWRGPRFSQRQYSPVCISVSGMFRNRALVGCKVRTRVSAIRRQQSGIGTGPRQGVSIEDGAFGEFRSVIGCGQVRSAPLMHARRRWSVEPWESR